MARTYTDNVEEIKLAFDNSGLSAYIGADAQQIIENILFDAQSFGIARVVTGIKDSKNVLDVQPGTTTITKGTLAAARKNAQGNTALKEVKVHVEPMAIYEEYEPSALIGKVPEILLKPGDESADTALQDMVMKLKGSEINKAVEKALWVGNSTLGVTGFVKEAIASATIKTGAAAVKLDASNAENVVNSVMNKLFDAKPEMEQEDTAMFMSPRNFSAWYRQVYKLNGQVDANTLNTGGPVTSAMIPGTNVRVYGMMGMIGDNNIVMGRPANFLVVTDLEDESQNSLTMKYSESDFLFQLSAAFKLGTKIARLDEVVITKA